MECDFINLKCNVKQIDKLFFIRMYIGDLFFILGNKKKCFINNVMLFILN